MSKTKMEKIMLQNNTEIEFNNLETLARCL